MKRDNILYLSRADVEAVGMTMREIIEALREADRLATDDVARMEYYREAGYFKNTPEPCADLGEIAAGKMPGREWDEERTISINLGLTLDDTAAAVTLYRRAREMGIGREPPL